LKTNIVKFEKPRYNQYRGLVKIKDKIMNDYFEFFQDAKGEWRWHKKNGGNHKIVASSGEGFSSRQAAVNNAKFSGYKGT